MHDYIIGIPFCLSFLSVVPPAAGAVTVHPANLERSDPVWSFTRSDKTSQPSLWFEAPFVGNGMVGAYATVNLNSKNVAVNGTVQLEVARADVWDVRLPGSKYYTNGMYVDTPRLGVGTFTLRPHGDIISGEARIHLRRATFSMVLHTTKGSVTFTVMAHATRPDLIMLEAVGTGDETNSGLSPIFTPRAADPPKRAGHPGYKKNPAADACQPFPVPHVSSTGSACSQKFLAGGGFATAFLNGSWGRYTLIAVANSIPAGVPVGKDASATAIGSIYAALNAGETVLLKEHGDWWNEYWGRSLLSVPDGVVESFLNLQLYKVGSATRCDGPDNCWMYDLMGPWYATSRWPDYHWDLNVQMSYWLTLPANQHSLHYSLSEAVKRTLPNMIASVPPAYRNDSAALSANTGFIMQATCDAFLLHKDSAGHCYQAPKSVESENPGVQLGNLAWLAHSLWWQYRYTMDSSVLKEAVVPVLKRAVSYYMRLSSKGSDGKIHLPYAESPEYGSAKDTNYDLALFRWGLGTLIHIAEKLLPKEVGQDPALPSWHFFAANLVPFPSDPATGLLIGDGVELKSGHRHWCHLFAMFPTALMDPAVSSLGKQSLDHFAALNGAGLFLPHISNGFTRAVTAIMSSMIPGRADAALRNLTNWFKLAGQYNKNQGGGSFGVDLGPNTMYQEAGGAPCNESPLGAAFSLQSFLLASWNFVAPENRSFDVIRVFPSMPSAWGDAAIGNMAAEGGYTVSAVWAGHETKWVAITSTTGPAKKKVHLHTDMDVPLEVSPEGSQAVFLHSEGGKHVIEVEIATDETILLGPRGSALPQQPQVGPVAWTDPKTRNWWGKHKRSSGSEHDTFIVV